MTPYDLLFILVVLTAAITAIAAFVIALGGKFLRAFKLLTIAATILALYVACVYLATASSSPRLIARNTPFCNDDWCLSVQAVTRNSEAVFTRYDIALNISNRARGRAQRENSASDVFLEDSKGNRFDPLLGTPEVPLNVLLQPAQSVKALRHFDVPIDAQDLRLGIGHVNILPFCTVIGQCDAFAKGTRLLLN